MNDQLQVRPECWQWELVNESQSAYCHKSFDMFPLSTFAPRRESGHLQDVQVTEGGTRWKVGGKGIGDWR
jgi:hypothetical protein